MADEVPTSVGEAVETAPAPRAGRAWRFGLTLATVLALLFGVPWWTLFAAGTSWPPAVSVLGALAFLSCLAVFPVLMYRGHGGRHSDRAARVGDTILGVVWVLFAWSLIGNVLRPVLQIMGVADPARSRVVAALVAGVSVVLLVWGYAEAMRVPRIRRVDVTMPRLGVGLDGVRVVVLTDTHYGPIDRTGWSAGVVATVNALDADIVCHTGDLADGTVRARRGQAAPLGDVRATLAKVYVTGNHEYFSGAQDWLDHMDQLGWQALHNRHVVVERGDARLVVAGVDDRTAASSGLAGHHADHDAALAGAPPDVPVLLLAHQPKQVDRAVARGVDLQVSGHTHGGQMWPFHYLVRLDQPVLQGLSRPGGHTQLYTSRGTGFWGPPFRIFAPSEITLLTLRAAIS
jgi:predicted MPP superfamily phosphohydrolase